MGLRRMKTALETGNTKRSLVFTDATWAGSNAYGGAGISAVNRTFTDLKNTISMA
jgi:hypothetical protein